ncbi:MAG: hypothetical protein JJV99_07795 [Colwellia sp.]|nr:hypothetical protein [Colwellia sp.]
MATEKQWTAYDSIQSYLTTELNSLANDALVLGAAIDFTTAGSDRKLFLDVEVYLNTVDLSTQTNPALYVWLLRRTDGTNFEDGGTSVTPQRAPDKIIPLREANAAQRVQATGLLTTPDQGKILTKNETGSALASDSNTLKYNLYSLADV